MLKMTIFLLLAVLVLAAASGCSHNDSVNGLSGNQNTNFTISQQITQSGSMQFRFTPAEDIKISQLVSRYPAEQFADTLRFGNPEYNYSKDSVYIINNYVNVVSGQKWIFDFTGRTPGSNSQYSVSVNYTVQ